MESSFASLPLCGKPDLSSAETTSPFRREPLDLAVGTLSRYPVTVFFVNCSPLPTLEGAIDKMRKATDRAIGGYANLGTVEETVGWSADDSITGERYATYALDWLAAGARIVGGCCGTRPEHIAAIRAAMMNCNVGSCLAHGD